MLIKQIPTSSLSSDAGANKGDRETSSKTDKENPSPPTPTATPPPAVDEEALRRLDKILRSIPSELDDAAAYVELKAKLGISWSKNPASPSKTKILPSSPKSPSPSTVQPSPSSRPKTASPLPSSPTSPSPSSPIQPMQTSEDTSDKEGWGRIMGSHLPFRHQEAVAPPL
ncbi:vegetative cell wall protein gp1-like [Salvia splendens]|uniref:vegetative cell wall protein gp1-like n=1 Tax=Salvia splendens TaxID=180675 RepID=UPI001C260458|nr:vegetative cell wall protein gp1-like [Salvia splendens]